MVLFPLSAVNSSYSAVLSDEREFCLGVRDMSPWPVQPGDVLLQSATGKKTTPVGLKLKMQQGKFDSMCRKLTTSNNISINT